MLRYHRAVRVDYPVNWAQELQPLPDGHLLSMGVAGLRPVQLPMKPSYRNHAGARLVTGPDSRPRRFDAPRWSLLVWAGTPESGRAPISGRALHPDPACESAGKGAGSADVRQLAWLSVILGVPPWGPRPFSLHTANMDRSPLRSANVRAG